MTQEKKEKKIKKFFFLCSLFFFFSSPSHYTDTRAMLNSNEVCIAVSKLPSAQQSTLVTALDQIAAGLKSMRHFTAQNHNYSVGTLHECTVNVTNNTVLVPVHEVDRVFVTRTAQELSEHLGWTVEMEVDTAARQCTICWQIAAPHRPRAFWWQLLWFVFWAGVLVVSALLYHRLFVVRR